MTLKRDVLALVRRLQGNEGFPFSTIFVLLMFLAVSWIVAGVLGLVVMSIFLGGMMAYAWITRHDV